MAAFVDLLGPQLVAPGNDKIKRFETLKTSEALSGKHVGLLFADSWCAPTLVLVSHTILVVCTRAAARRGVPTGLLTPFCTCGWDLAQV